MNVFQIHISASDRFYKEKIHRRSLTFLIIKLLLSTHGPFVTNTHQQNNYR